MKSYPDLFQPYGGFPDGVRVEDGYITMPDLPGIGFGREIGPDRGHARAGRVSAFRLARPRLAVRQGKITKGRAPWPA